MLTDPATGEQRCFEGHTSVVTCMAVHPSGRMVATAQAGSATRGTAAYASIWDVVTLRELARCGWSHSTDGGPGGGGAMRPCFTRNVCALAFSPDGALLLMAGTSSGDEHALCVFNALDGRLLARSVAMIARPVGVFDVLAGQAAPKALTRAEAAATAKAARAVAASTARAATRQGGGAMRAAAEAAERDAAAAEALAERTSATAADNAALLVVVVGAAPAPKYTRLTPPDKGGGGGGGWSMQPWKLGLYGGGASGGGGGGGAGGGGGGGRGTAARPARPARPPKPRRACAPRPSLAAPPRPRQAARRAASPLWALATAASSSLTWCDPRRRWGAWTRTAGAR